MSRGGQTRRKVCKSGRLATTVTMPEVLSLQHLPIELAAAEVGVCVTTFKKVCRKLGILRWPFRSSAAKLAQQADQTLPPLPHYHTQQADQPLPPLPHHHTQQAQQAQQQQLQQQQAHLQMAAVVVAAGASARPRQFQSAGLQRSEQQGGGGGCDVPLSGASSEGSDQAAGSLTYQHQEWDGRSQYVHAVPTDYHQQQHQPMQQHQQQGPACPLQQLGQLMVALSNAQAAGVCGTECTYGYTNGHSPVPGAHALAPSPLLPHQQPLPLAQQQQQQQIALLMGLLCSVAQHSGGQAGAVQAALLAALASPAHVGLGGTGAARCDGGILPAAEAAAAAPQPEAQLLQLLEERLGLSACAAVPAPAPAGASTAEALAQVLAAVSCAQGATHSLSLHQHHHRHQQQGQHQGQHGVPSAGPWGSPFAIEPAAPAPILPAVIGPPMDQQHMLLAMLEQLAGPRQQAAAVEAQGA